MKRSAKGERPPLWGWRIAEALNVGTVAGLSIATAAMFWSNRLIPVDFSERVALEIRVFFVVWGVCAVFALWRARRLTLPGASVPGSAQDASTVKPLAAPLLILLGFAALCLGMEKHYKEYFLHAPASRLRLRGLRVLGWLGLLLSFAACVAGEGWQVGRSCGSGGCRCSAWRSCSQGRALPVSHRSECGDAVRGQFRTLFRAGNARRQ